MKNPGSFLGEDYCPHPDCKKLLDSTTSASGSKIPPKEGDWTICIRCVRTLVYDAEIKVQIPTAEQLAQMTTDIKFELEICKIAVRKAQEVIGKP